ncbi:FtsK/SpoIIIE domain-containing protein [Dactylosporangium sp. CA-139066]|uniref:FtsK/SpoIIIE domain-containing protein n=1 Tax=Dactylosporangium sp. CA-139066 TaxID=3239930 RepID=UPI003D942DC0
MQATWGTVRVDLDATPHVLIGGTDGAGLEASVRGFIAALRDEHPPEELRILLADPHGHQFGRLGPTVVADTPYLLGRLNQVLLGELARRTRDPGARRPRLLVALWTLAGATELAPAVARIARDGAPLGVHLLVGDNRYVPIPVDPYLTLRASMRSFSERQSRDLLGVPDAYRLGVVGEALLRAGDAPPVWLRPTPCYEEIQLEAAGAPPLWTPPPGEPPIPDAGPDGGRRVRLGIVDRPFEHRRDPLVVDLGEGLAIVGGPRSGKTTAVRNLVTALAPAGVRVAVLDLAGHLADLASRPHVAAVAGGRDRDAVRQAARLAADDPGGVLLVVDGTDRLREHDDAYDVVRVMARRGMPLVVTAHRWNEPGPRIELRIDPRDSLVSPAAAALVPYEPGHGIVPGAEPGSALHVYLAPPPQDRT